MIYSGSCSRTEILNEAVVTIHCVESHKNVYEEVLETKIIMHVMSVYCAWYRSEQNPK